MNQVSQSICLLLYLTECVLLIQSTDLSVQQHNKDNPSDRDKRQVGDEFAKELVGKHSDVASGDNENTLEKRFMPYEELEKRLRYFIGKRTDDEEGIDKRSRNRYFLGKRGEDEVEKRARYFLGKRDGDDDEINAEKRYRYFLGKRDSGDLTKRRYYFLGKRPIILDNDLEKRRRFFLGKRRRFFLGKRDSMNNDLASHPDGYGEGDDMAESSQNGLKDFVQKRMRYFLGKRTDDSDGQDVQTDKRFGRYFLGR